MNGPPQRVNATEGLDTDPLEVSAMRVTLSSRRIPRHRCDHCRLTGAKVAWTWLGSQRVEVCAHLLAGKPGPAVSR